MLKSFTAIANAIRTAVGGLLQISGPSAGTTRTMTVPDADFIAARTDAGQTFTGVQVFNNNVGFGVTPQTPVSVGAGDTVDFLYPIATTQSGPTTYGGLYAIRDGVGDQRGLVFQVFTPNVGLNEKVRFPSAGGMVVGDAAIPTGASSGFLWVPTCAGTPTGTPTSYAGRAPIVVDTTNNKLYFYSSGSWRDAGP